MQKRYWFGLALVLLILLGAFCFPWLLLRWEQRQAEKQVLTVTEDAQLSVSQLSLSEKHLFLSNQTFVILQETELSTEESRQLADSALKELDILWRGGAVDDFSYFAAVEHGQDLQVRLCTAMTDVAVFRFYTLSDAEGFLRLYLDVDTEKILRLGLLEAWEQGGEMQMLLDTEKSVYSNQAWEEMQTWAQYYGLMLEDVQLWLEDDSILRQEALLTDEAGRRIVFGKLFNRENGGMGWQSVPETSDCLPDSIQFGVEEDTNRE